MGISRYMGYPTGASVGSTVDLGIVNRAFACIAVVLMDRAGRRPRCSQGPLARCSA